MDIVALKPILKRITKQQLRAELGNALSNGIDLSVTNLETYLTLKKVSLPNGLLNIASLGLSNQNLDFDASDYPVFPEVNSSNTITVSIRNLELLLESSSDDETRIFLNSVAWIGTNLVSTNGYILTRIENQINNKLNTSIMPRESIKELISLSKKFKLSEVTLSIDSDFFKVDNEYFTLMGRLIKREYLKYQAVIPVRTSQSMVITSPVKSSIVKDILNRNKAVRLETHDQVTTLVIVDSDFKTEIGISDFTGTVGFNLKYLEFLTNLDSNLKFNNELSPVLVSKGNITRIAMPLKV